MQSFIKSTASLVSLLALTSLLTGCGTTTGDVIAKYTRGTVPLPPTEAPRDGQYAIFSATDMVPKTQYGLQKGDRIGFVTVQDAQRTHVMAVAGEKQFDVETSKIDRSIAWKLLPRR